MIPKTIDLTNIREVKQPSYTYGLDLVNGRVAGKVDGLDAIKQAVYKILQTERYAHLIYSWNYGSELERYIGQDFEYVQASIAGEIKDSLMQDDRIKDVTDFRVAKTSLDSCLTSFVVHSNSGDFKAEKEVSV